MSKDKKQITKEDIERTIKDSESPKKLPRDPYRLASIGEMLKAKLERDNEQAA